MPLQRREGLEGFRIGFATRENQQQPSQALRKSKERSKQLFLGIVELENLSANRLARRYLVRSRQNFSEWNELST